MVIIYFITNVGRLEKGNYDIDFKIYIIYMLLVAVMSYLNVFERKYCKKNPQKSPEKMSAMCMEQRAVNNFCVQHGKTPTATKTDGGIRELSDSAKMMSVYIVSGIFVFTKKFVISRTFRGLKDLRYVRIA
jgi:hypothetical protein